MIQEARRYTPGLAHAQPDAFARVRLRRGRRQVDKGEIVRNLERTGAATSTPSRPKPAKLVRERDKAMSDAEVPALVAALGTRAAAAFLLAIAILTALHSGTDDVLGVPKPIQRSKPETGSRLRSRIERVLDHDSARPPEINARPPEIKKGFPSNFLSRDEQHLDDDRHRPEMVPHWPRLPVPRTTAVPSSSPSAIDHDSSREIGSLQRRLVAEEHPLAGEEDADEPEAGRAWVKR